MCVSEAAGLRPVGHAELAVDVRQVELDRLLRNEELTGEPAVRRPRCDESKQLELALREAERGVRRLGLLRDAPGADRRVRQAMEDRAAHDLAQERPR